MKQDAARRLRRVEKALRCLGCRREMCLSASKAASSILQEILDPGVSMTVMPGSRDASEAASAGPAPRHLPKMPEAVGVA